MTTAVLVIAGLAASIAAALAFAARRLRPEAADAAQKINDLLPQTQCGRCGYPGCRPYAEAIVDGTAEINLCPPGGEATIVAIGRLLARPPLPPDPNFGEFEPAHIACIDENACIGCALCLQECPVDAILGAPHYMHTVIAAECTGCELCVAPCPVDCIKMVQE